MIRSIVGSFSYRYKKSQVCGSSANGAVLVCVSRDDDGRNPWVVASMKDDGTTLKLPGVLFKTFDQCKAAVSSSRNILDSFSLLCTSRDGDGRTPFEIFKVSSDNTVTNEGLVFKEFEDCTASLQKAKQTPKSIIACASRDGDGRDPWALFAVTESTTNKTHLSYKTRDECLAQ